MSNRAFVVFAIVVVGIGTFAGYQLSALPKFEGYKLLNVVGLLYNFLGIVVLSELLTPNPKWKAFSVNVMAPVILWLHTLVPLGAFVGGGVAAGLKHGSGGSEVSTFAIVFWAYSLIPLSILDAWVVFPRISTFKTLESRWRYWGLYLLAAGVGLQLVSAFLGFT